jgi:hypothetical protein
MYIILNFAYLRLLSTLPTLTHHAKALCVCVCVCVCDMRSLLSPPKSTMRVGGFAAGGGFVMLSLAPLD